MEQYIPKSALIAEINKRIIDAPIDCYGHQRVWAYNDVKDIIDTMEVKEVEEEHTNRNPADIASAMQEVEEKSRAFTEAHQGESSDEILAQMRGEEPVIEDLEEEIECSLPKPALGWNEDYFGKSVPAYSMEQMKDIAKRFFELGRAVSNPITAADRGTAEEIITNLKRVEQDYRVNLTKEIEWLRNKVKKGEEV